jgi:hypothetical protein
LKKYMLKLEGVGNAGLTLFQRRVLLKSVDQKQSLQLS